MRIPDNFLNCICFLGQLRGGKFSSGGTGFFVAIPSEVHAETIFIYLVTAKHCVKDDLHLRVNTVAGGSDLIATGAAVWTVHENPASDIAVLPWAPDRTVYQYSTIPVSMLATPGVITEKDIGIGVELVVTGLFVRHVGQQRNLPVVRSGIIAAMPGELLTDPENGDYRAYIAEVRSIGGLSGSPVFGLLGPVRSIDGALSLRLEYVLLGVMRGHWDEKSDKTLKAVAGSEDAVNMGMAVVTPADELHDILYGTSLAEHRKKIDDATTKANGALK